MVHDYLGDKIPSAEGHFSQSLHKGVKVTLLLLPDINEDYRR